MSKEKIDTNPEKRLKKIIDIAIEIQNSRKRKKMKKLAHEIEILANTKLIKGLNKSMEDFEKGRYVTIEEFKNKLKREDKKKNE